MTPSVSITVIAGPAFAVGMSSCTLMLTVPVVVSPSVSVATTPTLPIELICAPLPSTCCRLSLSVAVTVTLPVAPAAIEAGALRFSVTASRVWPASRKPWICVPDTSCQKMSWPPVPFRSVTRPASAGKRKRRQIVRARRERQRRRVVHFARQAWVRARRPRRRQRGLIEVQRHRRRRRRNRAIVDRDHLCRRRGVAVAVRDLVGEARADAGGIVQVRIRIERPRPIGLECIGAVDGRERGVSPAAWPAAASPEVDGRHCRAVGSRHVIRKQIVLLVTPSVSITVIAGPAFAVGTSSLTVTPTVSDTPCPSVAVAYDQPNRG